MKPIAKGKSLPIDLFIAKNNHDNIITGRAESKLLTTLKIVIALPVSVLSV